ncbi:class I SAM-dependent methyltransferase [Micromonospora mirobrigensis]|uniref:Ubiquinone/menaquinone biosynthesis C-methylase UbiE n=1 Tax=Micromonospora mirobrigensis TaxID=262898 RepID=A0A1C5AM75_9ACTN|nr:class I SAM-dependent methyltransferase [Micromonospora mirobrigensis]SCF46342.1 Ubiquinone/menaquinone biosynthesis C-methylase UbiE [Micromonospora mirobrigensis]
MDPAGTARSARVAALFDRVADTYDNVGVPWFTPVAEGLVRELAPRPGERALDVGCGRGAVLLPLAEAVGPTGSVTGVDLAPAMVAATRAEAAQRGLAQVDVRLMDATAPDLPAGGYDLVASSLVLFFLPDPAAALRAWRELLVPGGRLGVATFGDRDPRWEELDAIFRPYLPPQLLDARTSGTAGPFASDAGVEELLTAAGYQGVRTVGLDIEAVFTGPEHWYAFSMSHGQRVMWEAVGEDERARVRAATTDFVGRLRGADGTIRLTQRVRYTLGERPAADAPA